VTPDLVAGRWKAVVLMRSLGGSVTAEVASVEFELQPVAALKAGRSGAAVKATMQVFTPGRDSQ